MEEKSILVTEIGRLPKRMARQLDVRQARGSVGRRDCARTVSLPAEKVEGVEMLEYCHVPRADEQQEGKWPGEWQRRFGGKNDADYVDLKSYERNRTTLTSKNSTFASHGMKLRGALC
ncbi:hypothetical protein PR003_g18428 [Phytophthora rubi]|uniref:Uncharacterized protein n=1 Tax=Phytophthora rubi TaxID=129364 RepID=A0A6A4E6A2_9STRA|nr:hypothetical protein PR002_g18723 [Phytophthora rubi]KAE9006578.1 hypothetical protein PR001_g17168 [Phytophthora rubi]KAE9317616.1 hypothetical protein PR003_g18428 [Phytophthora rubi]